MKNYQSALIGAGLMAIPFTGFCFFNSGYIADLEEVLQLQKVINSAQETIIDACEEIVKAKDRTIRIDKTTIEGQEVIIEASQEKVKEKDKIIKLKEAIIYDRGRRIGDYQTTLQAKDRLIDSLERIIDSKTKGLETLFPEYFSVSEIRLTPEEQADLTKLLTEHSSEGEEIDPKSNLCVYNSVNLYRGEITNRYSGNCVFLSPTLVLTSLHLESDELESTFYDNEDLVKTNSKESYFVEDVLAISPRYDLVLVRIEGSYDGAKVIPLGKVAEETSELKMYSCVNGGDICSESELQELDLTVQGYKTDLQIVVSGELMFPSVVALPRVDKGYSGSPVFEGDYLVGLVAMQGEDSSYLSDHVYDFVVNVVND
tara:strand:- start:2692 stop:3804 length:1113 start_codon:yes stop_codon:yes gene_type:complete